MYEPWEYVNIIEAIKWWDERMMPEIRLLIQMINQRSAKAWKILQANNRTHSDFKQLSLIQRKVRDEWFKRPRWNKDRGRVQEEGY